MSYVSQRSRAIPPSGLESFFDLLAGMDDVLSLGIGEPDVPSPTAVRRAGMASIDRGDTGYTSNAGIAALRERIAADLAARYGVHYDPGSEILVTVGVSEALHIAMLALVDPGDEVLIPEPCFVSYDPCVRLADGVTHWVPTHAEDGFAVRLPAREAAVSERSRALLLSYPNNPTGAVMTREEMLAVARFAEAHALLVISDEIYDRFVYGIEHTCVAALPGMRERTLLMGGFSKSHAMTGLRLGYVCGPAELIRASTAPTSTSSCRRPRRPSWRPWRPMTTARRTSPATWPSSPDGVTCWYRPWPRSACRAASRGAPSTPFPPSPTRG
jgi:aminotransferase